MACFVVPSIEPLKIASEIHSNSLDSYGISDAICLVQYDDRSSDVISQCINTAVYLRNSSFPWNRSYSRWEGGYIAVISGICYVDKIRYANLFGLEKGVGMLFDEPYRNHKTHMCLTMPVLLSSLLVSVTTIGKIRRHKWDQLSTVYPGITLFNHAKETLDSLESGRYESKVACEVCKNIIDGMNRINWRLTLAHGSYKLVDPLIYARVPENMIEAKTFLRKALSVFREVLSLKGMQYRD
jgi:hypothetical protein